MTKRTGMARRALLLAILTLTAFAFSAGCAYYNTFYNIKKEFRAAEKQTERAQLGQQTTAQGSTTPSQTGSAGIPAQQYQAILQSCSKLLEYYPKSRWIDDALMIMGVCYYRTEEFARAERKFTELLAIFPNSKHAQMAVVWKARALLEQDQFDVAEELLTSSESRLKSADVKAAAGRTLASIYDKRERPEEAITYLEGIRSIAYDRDDKASDFLTLGRSYLALHRNEDAKRSLEQCLRSTRNATEAFTARSLLARMAAEAGNYEPARAYLHPLQTDRRFLDRVGDVQVELAKVEAVAGDPVLAIQMLEYYCSTANQGEVKARAYMLQGFVARDKLRELEIARAKFDSVGGMGASRELADSARVLANQLQRGLSALERIPALQDSLTMLTGQSVAVQRAAPQEVATPDTLDSHVQETSVDSVQTGTLPDEEAIAPTGSDIAADTMLLDSMVSETIPLDSLTEQKPPADTLTRAEELPKRTMTPAQMMADSIMRSMMQEDSLRKAQMESVFEDTLSVEESADTSSLANTTDISIAHADSVATPEEPSGPTPAEVEAMRLAALSKNLINAHLEAASFYDEVLNEQDSSLFHIKAASEVPDSSSDHWRAVVQYGLALQERDQASAESRELLLSVSNDEEIPRDLRNAARDLVGLPPIAQKKTVQELELNEAERMLLNGESITTVLGKYSTVARMDSHSYAGSQALQAIAYLQEYRLSNYESALVTHAAIIELFPDSQYVAISRAKVSEPDSMSVFLLSEEDLEGTFQPALELLATDADSTGWPPEESSLLGRRFR